MYFIIDNYPIFLTYSRFTKLRNEALKNKSAKFRVASMMSSKAGKQSKENSEAESLMYDYLLKKYYEDKNLFLKQWHDFILSGKKASENIWDLLYDYCHYNKFGEIIDMRDHIDKMLDLNSYNYPQGKKFVLKFNEDKNKWWDFFKKKKENNVNIIVDINKVNIISGTLTDFKVDTDTYTLYCSEGNININ